jgi:hypothetical protein
MQISERNIRLYTSETPEEFEARLQRETEGMCPTLAKAHRTRQTAWRTRAENILATRQQQERRLVLPPWLAMPR